MLDLIAKNDRIRSLYYNFVLARDIFLRKPLFLFRVIKNYLLAKIPGTLKPLRFTDISVTHACNFSCKHCSEQNIERSGEVLSLRDYRELGRELLKSGVLVFHFTGGEPLVRKDLPDILRCFGPNRSMISLQTNGSLATPQLWKVLKHAGLDFVCISIDSSDPQVHDHFRGHSGSWEKCWRALREAQAAGLRASVSTFVNHQNIRSRDLDRIVQMAKAADSTVFFNLAVPIGNFKNSSNQLLTSDDRDFLNDYILKNPHCRTDFESNYFVHGCGAIKEKLYISPEGNVLPCPFIHVVCGNIRNSSIREIRHNALNIVPEVSRYASCCLAAEDRVFQRKYYGTS